MKTRFNNLPLRHSIPFMLLVMFIVATLVSMMISILQSKTDLIAEAEQHARTEAIHFARNAENQLISAPKSVKRMIMLHAAEVEDFNSTMTALVDPQGKVIYSYHDDWAGRTLSDVMPSFDRMRFIKVQKSNLPDMQLNEQLTKLSIIEPFDYPRAEKDIASTAKGAVFIEYDLNNSYHVAFLRQLLHHLPHLFAGLLAFVLFAWWLRRKVSLPLEELSSFTRAIGTGQFNNIVRKVYPGELQELNENLTLMAQQIQQDQQILLKERDISRRYLETVNAIVVVLDASGQLQMINAKGCQLLGYNESELLGCNWFEKCIPQPDGMMQVYPVFLQIMAGHIEAARYFENKIMAKDGKEYLVAWHNGYFMNEVGNITGTISSGEDITERKLQQESLRKLSLAVEQSPESVIITDLNANIEYVNSAFITNTGYSLVDVIGRNPRMLQSGKTPRQTYEAQWSALTRGDVWQGEFINKRKDGSEYIISAIISVVRNDAGKVINYLAIEQDITARKHAEHTIHTLAFFDSLTGLANRSLLLDRISLVLPFAHRQQRIDALIVLNIDRFKILNDVRGQHTGDELLKKVSARLTEVLRDGDVAARLGGDEFAILLHGLAYQGEDASLRLLHIAEHIQQFLAPSYELDSERVALSFSAGIAMFPTNADDTPLDVLRRATTALHDAKAKGGAQIKLFENALDETAKQRFQVERELRHGITNGELRLFLQPQVDVQGQIVGAEALVRWQHPSRGLLAPNAFIAIAEESDLIIDLGNWVLTEVCKLLTKDIFTGSPFRISVNVSPRQFRHDGFAENVLKVLQNTGAESKQLTLEVTEGLMLDNVIQVVATMTALSAEGIHFSIDDFGTGYSSLIYLKRLPIDELKIDKVFVQDAPNDPDDAALIDVILSLAQHLHLKVVAEGVETQAQADFLNERGTVIHQGYLFGKPEPAEVFVTRFTNNLNH